MKYQVVLIKSPTNCRKCVAARQLLDALAAEFGDELAVTELVSISDEAARYGILLTPAIVINDFIVSTGKVPRLEKLRAWLQQQ